MEPLMDKRAENIKLLKTGRPDIACRLIGLNEDGLSILLAENGMKTLVANLEGKQISLHSRYDPEEEARRFVENAYNPDADVILVMGFGLAYHLRSVLEKTTETQTVIIVEPDIGIFNIAASHVELKDIIDHPSVKPVIGEPLINAKSSIERVIEKHENAGVSPIINTLIHKPSVRLHEAYYNSLLNWIDALRFGSPKTMSRKAGNEDRLHFLLLDSGYFLLREMELNLIKLGHSVTKFRIGRHETDIQRTYESLIRVIRSHRPDILLTVNHLGFDSEGMLASLLETVQLPFASWFVDSPLLILGDAGGNKSDFCSLFVWDEDYTAPLKAKGFKHVHFLPLGVEETVFNPLRTNGGVVSSSYRRNITFVGDSLTQNCEWDSIKKRTGLNGTIQYFLDRASKAFINSRANDPRESIRTAIENDYTSSFYLDPAIMGDLSRIVIRNASKMYRQGIIKSLKRFHPSVIGDPGWKNLLDELDFNIMNPVGYYSDLPAVYRSSIINLNITSLQMKNGMNQRIFDVPACNGFLLTDYRKQLEDHFEIGREAVCYRNAEELNDMVEFYLNNPDARIRIAKNAGKRVLSEHTYKCRISRMIEILKGSHL